MADFYVGQRVICVDAGSSDDMLEEGQTYTVNSVGVGGFLQIKETVSYRGLAPFSWRSERFKVKFDGR
jgi:hypothetical protein